MRRRAGWLSGPIVALAALALGCADDGSLEDQNVGRMTDAIIGGATVPVSTWPSMTAVFFTPTSGPTYQSCGATMISADVAVTAAHCVNTPSVGVFPDPTRFTVAVAPPSISGVTDRFRVQSIVIHPDFNTAAPRANDVALLILMHGVTGTTMRMLDPIRAARVPVGTSMRIIGWGKMEGGVSSDTLREATVGLRGIGSACVGLPFPPPSTAKVVSQADHTACLGNTNNTATACSGDSGGPALVNLDNEWFVAGVTSTGTFCGSGITNYTWLPDFYTWATGVVPRVEWTPENSLYVQRAGVLWRADDQTGTARAISRENWSGATSAATLNGSLFVVQDNGLHKVDPKTGTYATLGGPNWPGPTSMATVGGSLFIQEGAGLWKITNLSTGAFQRVGSVNWTGATSMTSANGSLFIIKDDHLFRVNPSNGTRTDLGAGWGGPTTMTAVGSTLFATQDNSLWSVNPTTGTFAFLGDPGVWGGTLAMTSLNSSLFIIQTPRLYRVSTADGGWTELSSTDWTGATAMAALP